MSAAPQNLQHGAIRLADGSVEWNVWAPRACAVELVFPVESLQVPMEPRPRGWFTCRLDTCPEARHYEFRLHDSSGKARTFPDPASRWQPEGVHRPSALFFPDDFEWTDHDWRGLPLDALVFYELHVGTFTEAGTFAAMEPRLAELADLGVTAIEIMPVAQFPGVRNWGYDGVHPFAVQNSYGGPRALQRLVDACHRHGLAIFLDVVYNHFGPEGNYTAEFGPYLTDKYRTPWGPAWNFDDRGSENVRQFVCENVAYWLRDFHFDGLRLDAVHAIYDRGPRHILTDIQRVADRIAGETGRQIQIVAESNLNDVRLLDPVERRGNALAAVWSDDFHHAVHALLTGERDGYYIDFGKPEQLVKAINHTYVYDGNYSAFRDRHHGAPDGGHLRQRFVVNVQTHDQVGNRARGDRFGSLLTFEQQLLAAATLLLSPFTPLLFMGEEYGEDRLFPFFCSFGDAGLVEAVERGRLAEFKDFTWPGAIPSPNAEATFRSAILSWSWPAASARARLREWYRWLLELRRTHLISGDRHGTATWHACGANDDAGGVLELTRRSVQPAGTIVALLNYASKPTEVPLASQVAAGGGRPDLLRSSSGEAAIDRTAPLAPFEVRVYHFTADANV
jgi:maltooligosyltrehalose trehalohydrolase